MIKFGAEDRFRQGFVENNYGYEAGKCPALPEEGADGAFGPFLDGVLWRATAFQPRLKECLFF